MSNQNFTADHKRAVFNTTRWQRYLYTQRVASGGAVQTAEVQIAGSIQSAKENQEIRDPDADDTTQEESNGDASTFGGEVFSRLYNDPQRLEESSGPAWMSKAQDLLGDLPEWDQLRRSVEGDPDFSALASARVMSEIAPKLEQLIEESEDGDSAGESSKDGMPSGSDMVRSAMRSACRSASEEVAETRSAMAGLASGLEATPPSHEQADPARMQLAERLRNDSRLKDVIRRAGRMERIAAKVRPTKSDSARSEVVDIERGADLSRILPSQLAGLRHPLMRKLVLKSIVERSALQYKLGGSQPEGRGPIVVLLDESGSMQGDPHTWARAIGVAAIGQGSREKRQVTVIGFNGNVRSVFRLTKSGEGQSIDLRSGDARSIGGVAQVALAVASQSASGGTSFDAVFEYALKSGLRDDRADLVLVTDGNCSVSSSILEAVAEQKESGMRVWGMTVNGGSLGTAVAELCDSAVDLDDGDIADSAGRFLR